MRLNFRSRFWCLVFLQTGPAAAPGVGGGHRSQLISIKQVRAEGRLRNHGRWSWGTSQEQETKTK